MSYSTDDCIKLERIYEIYRNPQLMTAKEKSHVQGCKKCQEHYILAQVFDSYLCEDEKAADLQFPSIFQKQDDEMEDELLLAGAKRRDDQEGKQQSIDFMMTYVASEKSEKSEDYWKARLNVHSDNKLQIVRNGKFVERVKIDFHVIDENGQSQNGTLYMLSEEINIIDGKGEIYMDKDKFESTLQNPKLECSFKNSLSGIFVPGELFWTNNF